MIIHKPKQKAGTSFSQLSQKRDDGFTNWPGDKGNCFFSLQEDPTIAQALGVVEMWSVLSILNAIYRMIRNANSSVIWLSSYKCQWQPVCCIGNSSNRLTTAQFHGSGGGRQTAALSAVISKGAKRPFQRQLGVGVLKGEGDATPGGRQAQSRSATRCQHVCLLHGDCKPNTVQGGQKISQESQKDEHPSQSTGHSTWVPGTTDPVLSLHHVSLLCPQVPCLETLGGQWTNFPICPHNTSFRQTLEGR